MLKDWEEWFIIIALLGMLWVWDDPSRAGRALSDVVTEFQIGIEEGRR